MRRLFLPLLLLSLLPTIAHADFDEVGFSITMPGDQCTYAGFIYYEYDPLPDTGGNGVSDVLGSLEGELSLWVGRFNLRYETGVTFPALLWDDGYRYDGYYDDHYYDDYYWSVSPRVADLYFSNLSLYLGWELEDGLALSPYIAWRYLEREISYDLDYPYDYSSADHYLGGGGELMLAFGDGSSVGLLLNQGFFSSNDGARYYSGLEFTTQLPFLPVTENFTAGLEVSDFYGGGETYLVLTARMGIAF